MFRKYSIGILGGSGLLGQTYAHLLKDHPWFEIHFVGSSKCIDRYPALVEKSWIYDTPPPDVPVVNYDSLPQVDLLFSTLPNEAAKFLEPRYAKQGFKLISHASYFRENPWIPLVIPEINAHHLKILSNQQKMNNWKGWIVSKPNCTLPSFLLPLYPLMHHASFEYLHITTLQSRSGAGLDALSQKIPMENVIPFIEGEEHKTQTEPLKLLGNITSEGIAPLTTMKIQAHCTRVSMPFGHLATVTAQLKHPTTISLIKEVWKSYPSLELPSSPKTLFHITDIADPQLWISKLNLDVAIGNIRLEDLTLKFTALSHNVLRGGSGGGIYIAEQIVTGGYLDSTQRTLSNLRTHLSFSTDPRKS